MPKDTEQMMKDANIRKNYNKKKDAVSKGIKKANQDRNKAFDYARKTRPNSETGELSRRMAVEHNEKKKKLEKLAGPGFKKGGKVKPKKMKCGGKVKK